MNYTEIAGSKHPFLFTTGAAKQFKSESGVSITKLNPEDFDQLSALVYCGFVWGYKYEGKEAPKNLKELVDFLPPKGLLQHMLWAMQEMNVEEKGEKKK